MRFMIVFLLCVLSSTSLGDTLKPADFAYGLRLRTVEDGSIFKITVPNEVYSTVTQSGLADLVVFNGDEEVVPSFVRTPDGDVQKKMVSLSVPFFPLASNHGSVADDLLVEIAKEHDGDVVRIIRSQNKQPAELKSYLLDMQDITSHPVKLQLFWQQDGGDGLLSLQVETSDDLVEWKKTANATLANISHMGHRLFHNTIDLKLSPGKFLRITSMRDDTSFTLERVEVTPKPQLEKGGRVWKEFIVKHMVGKHGEITLGAELSGIYPIDSLQLILPQPNSLLRVRINILEKVGKQWSVRGQKLYYWMNQKGAKIENEPFYFPREEISAVMLDVLQDGVGYALPKVKLKVGYVPHEMLFLARGKQPFILAFGNANSLEMVNAEKHNPLNSLLLNMQPSLIKTAIVEEKVELAGEEALVKKEKRPWRKMILWFVLITGVAILSVMAYVLIMKMKNEQTE